MILKATGAHTLVQPSDRSDCLFRIEIRKWSCDWSNFLTRKGVFQFSLQVNLLARREERNAGVVLSICQATEAHTLV